MKIDPQIRLTMNKAALEIAGHVIQSHQNWPPIDRSMAWSLFLVCFYGCSHVGDLLSNTANKATDKTLRWDQVLPSGRILIYISSPKSSVENRGNPIVISTNPDTRFCPVFHLSKIRSFYEGPGPVFCYFSGNILESFL